MVRRSALTALLLTLPLLLLCPVVPALADDYWISMSDSGDFSPDFDIDYGTGSLAEMGASLLQIGLWGVTLSDFNVDFNADFGSGNGANFNFWGRCQFDQQGSWKLRVVGQRLTPKPQVTLQPSEPGNFTKNTGKPIWPPYATGTNSKVGIQSIPDTVSTYWAWLSWNCYDPLPNFGALGLAIQRDNTGGAAGGPYGSHF